MCSFVRLPMEMMLLQIKTFALITMLKKIMCLEVLVKKIASVLFKMLCFDATVSDSSVTPAPHGGVTEMASGRASHYVLPLTFLHFLSPERLWSTGKEDI